MSPRDLSAAIAYQLEPQLEPAEFLDVLERSTLAERRPVHESATLAGMLRHADVIVTARIQGRLVGVARALTDFSFCTYLSDLAVDAAVQRQGIGQELLRRAHAAAGTHTTLILLAAPRAESYYPAIGLDRHPSCWIQKAIPGPQPPSPRLSPRVVPSLFVRDLAETLDFYCSRLGFHVTGRHPETDPPRWAEVTRDAVSLQFFTEKLPGLPDHPALSGTLYFYPGDVRALAAELRKKVPFAWGPEEMDYGMREFAVRDPSGYLIAFAEPM